MSEEGAELFHTLLTAPDRDRCPGLRPVVSCSPGDDPGFLEAVDARTHRRLRLERHGQWHGEWAELEESAAPASGLPLEAEWTARWHEARPIVLRGLFEAELDVSAERASLHEELTERGGLRHFLQASQPNLDPPFRVGRDVAANSERGEIERILLAWSAQPERRGSAVVRDLWVRSRWLSAGGEERSLLLETGFGGGESRARDRDPRLHRRVAELGEALLPEALLLARCEELLARLAAFVGAPALLTRHALLWLAPGGGLPFGARGLGSPRPPDHLGHCYLQLSGQSAWLALSTDDLVRRCAELVEYLVEGELSWVRRALYAEDDALEGLKRLLGDHRRARRELARPGCGLLRSAVDRGPEFSALLADAGHALVLEPGDLLLLPSHGFELRCAASLFAAHESEVSAGLTAAIRELHPAESDPLAESGSPPRRPRRGRRRRR